MERGLHAEWACQSVSWMRSRRISLPVATSRTIGTPAGMTSAAVVATFPAQSSGTRVRRGRHFRKNCGGLKCNAPEAGHRKYIDISGAVKVNSPSQYSQHMSSNKAYTTDSKNVLAASDTPVIPCATQDILCDSNQRQK